MPRYTDVQLKEIARTHVAYECRMLADQVATLGEWRALRLAPGPHSDALIEASLVHVRLLDDFFKTPEAVADRRHDDVTAEHYDPSWKPAGFLAPAEVIDINGQLHHLAARRVTNHVWDLADMRRRAADHLALFHDGLAGSNPLRAPWFADARAALDPFCT